MTRPAHAALGLLAASFAAALCGCPGSGSARLTPEQRALVEADRKALGALWPAMLDADEFEVLSLDPASQRDRPPTHQRDEPAGPFHGWKVLGATPVSDREARRRLLAALERGVEDSDGVEAKCFEPRHGLRARGPGVAVDLVICFRCSSVRCYVGAESGPFVSTTASPEPAFDEALRAAGVPMAPKP